MTAEQETRATRAKQLGSTSRPCPRTVRSSLNPKAVPDAVAVAQSILGGVEPPDLYWNLKPHCKTLGDINEETCRDYYLRPRRYLQESWPLEYLVIVSPTRAVESGIDKDPAYKARVIEQALLDSLGMLNRIVEDGIRQTNPFSCSLERVTKNDRLRHRLAAAIHDELAALLMDWNQIVGSTPIGAQASSTQVGLASL